MTDEQAKTQAEILNNGDGWDCYVFAKDISGGRQ